MSGDVMRPNSANKSLDTYLHDHLAGATLLIDLLVALEGEENDLGLKSFFADLLLEVRKDRESLQTLAHALGGGSSTPKELFAWAAEKASRLKLRRPAVDAFQTFEAMELIQLGIQGKLQLWRALHAASVTPSGGGSLDYSTLSARAEAQIQAVDAQRLRLASAIFLKR